MEAEREQAQARRDGEIGHVEDFFFDDLTWTIPYLVVDTGPWLFGRKVLIAPEAMREPEWSDQMLPVNLRKEQVENSPEVDLEQPVSHQKEEALRAHYGWGLYWPALQTPGVAATPGALPLTPPLPDAEPEMEEEGENPHLRSADKVINYTIQALDDNVGHVSDFLAEDDSWIIRYLVVNTSDRFSGRDVLISPQWIRRIEWELANVYVGLEKETIKNSPEYNPSRPIDREYEARLYEHYDRPLYW